MKKETIIVEISVHPIQKIIVEGLKNGKIELENDTLREIAKKINCKESPQMIKHHIMQLVKLGIIDIIGGRYILNKETIK